MSVVRSRPPDLAGGLGWRNERLDQAILVIAQSLAGPKVADPGAICRRPHSGLLAGEPSGCHHHSIPALVKPSRRPFQNGLLDSPTWPAIKVMLMIVPEPWASIRLPNMRQLRNTPVRFKIGRAHV